MSRYYYREQITTFISSDTNLILGLLAQNNQFALEESQRRAWVAQIKLLKSCLQFVPGEIALEYSIPRMGKRIDCIIVSDATVFAIEFKVGADTFEKSYIVQTTDYALDLKNFHQHSHNVDIVPILVCTNAPDVQCELKFQDDRIAEPFLTNGKSIETIIGLAKNASRGATISANDWFTSIYRPTPTIIQAAQALYQGHTVSEISRHDAGAINLSKTSTTISHIIEAAKQNGHKSICFLTGVPGAGKTLAGLDLANSWHNSEDSEHAVFLSGNGPLVEVLR